MKVSGLLIGLVVSILLATAGTIVITEFVAHDSGFVVDGGDAAKYKSFNTSYAQIKGMNDTITGLKGGLEATISANPLDWIGGLYRAGFNTFKLIFGSVTFVGAMLTSAQTIFGFDARLVAVVVALVSLVVIFALFSAIFQMDV